MGAFKFKQQEALEKLKIKREKKQYKMERKKRKPREKKSTSDKPKLTQTQRYPKKPCPICLHPYLARCLIAKCVARHEEELSLDVPVTCPLCLIEVESKRVLTNHFADHHEGKTCCCECLLVMPNEKNRLRKHFISKHHSAGKPEICSKCGKTLSTARELKIHMEGHDSNGAICPECGKVFQSRKDMVHHLNHNHRERDLKCPYCEKMFANRQQARKHVAMHTGFKPYRCLQCNYSAYRQTNVHTHVAKTHGCQAINENIIVNEPELERMNELVRIDVDRMMSHRRGEPPLSHSVSKLGLATKVEVDQQ